MIAKLVAIRGEKAGEEIPISAPRFLVGRGDDCDFQPKSILIGRLHCIISLEEDSVGIEDCGGAIGTFVNGERIQYLRHELKNGDRIKIDKSEYEVRIVADEDEAKRQPIHNVNLWDVTVRSFSSTAIGKSQDDDNAKPNVPSRVEKEAQRHRESIQWSGTGMLLAAIAALMVVIVSSLLPEEWPSFQPAHSMRWHWTRFIRSAGQWWQAGWVGWGVLVIVLVGWTLFLSLRAWRERRGKT